MPLVTAIWGVGLVSIVAVSLLSTSHVSYRLARHAVEAARADALAEAGLNRAILALLEPQFDRRPRTDGVAQRLTFESSSLLVSIQDELGRIDLNQADGSLLVNLFQSVGLDFQSASSLADKILDWRDSASLKRLNGAKEPEYRAAGLPYRPRNGPFQSVDELKLVMGMTPDLFRRVEPAVTVYSGRQFVDPQVAPREVLLALPSMDADKVDSLIQSRTQQMFDSAGQTLLSLGGRAFSVRIEVDRPAGVLRRQWVVRITDSPTQPYWLLSQKSG